MKLYNWPSSPFGAKVRMTINVLGLDDSVKHILCHPWEKNTFLTSINPLTKIPILVTDDDMVIFDSPVICEYLASLTNSHIYPVEHKARFVSLRKQALADGIMDAGVAVRYENSFRPSNLRSKDWINRQMRTIKNGVKMIAHHGIELPPPLLSKVTIGGIAIFAALDYLMLRFPEEQWIEPGSHLKDWFKAMAAIPQISAGRANDDIALPSTLDKLEY